MKDIFKRLSNSFLLLLICFGFLTFQGCKKSWLEAKVDKQQAVPTTIDDFQAMLDNYSPINVTSTSAFGEIAADGHYYTDAIWNTFKGAIWQNVYTATNDVQYINVTEWIAPYAAISYTNIVLDELQKIKGANNISAINDIKGQALFTRAFTYFSLAQIFAPQFESSKAEKLLGLPLRLSSDLTIPSTRATLKDTYDQILSDLLIAKDILPNNPVFLTRASRIAVLGLLSRVYLTIGDYGNALKYSNEYLSLKNTLLDFNLISTTANFIGVNNEICYIKFYSASSRITSDYLISPDLLNLYKDGDLRKKIFFKTGAAGTQFKGTYGNTATDIFAGIATDEIFLIRAECYARNGDLISSMKDLNDLVRTRWEKNANGTTKYVDQIAIDQTDALRKIFEERRKQLILRNVRWTDLRRNNLDDRFKTTLVRTVGGQTYTLEPNSFRYTFPIPQDIIAKTGMSQNLEW